jgi:hypothetical protein
MKQVFDFSTITKFTKSSTKNSLEFIILGVMYYLIAKYSLDYKLLYPDWVLTLYLEPGARFIFYILMYFIANNNPVRGIMYFILIIFVHIDVIQYGKSIPKIMN